MRFLVDESTGRRLHVLLKEAGHDSVFVGDVMISSNDEDVLASSENEKRILITDDKDFGELVFRLSRPATGVVLLRLEETDPKKRLEILINIMNAHNLEGCFITVQKDRIRIRRLPV